MVILGFDVNNSIDENQLNKLNEFSLDPKNLGEIIKNNKNIKPKKIKRFELAKKIKENIVKIAQSYQNNVSYQEYLLNQSETPIGVFSKLYN